MSDILRVFQSTAQREAYRFGANAIGRLVVDVEDGLTYLVYGEGLGADVTFPLDTSGGGGGGGGGLGFSQFYPDAPPTSPHVADDEFTAGSLASKWNLWDPGGIVSAYGVDTTRRMMTISFGGQNATRAAGVYQNSANPDTEWTIYAKIALLQDEWGGSDHRAYAALFVGGSTIGSGTVDVRAVGLEHTWGSPIGMHAASSAWNSYQGNTGFTRRDYNFHCYFRMRHKPAAPGAILSFESSPDGVSWQKIAVATSAIALAHYGIMVGQFGNNTGKTNKALVKFFRVFEYTGASAYDGSCIGRYI